MSPELQNLLLQFFTNWHEWHFGATWKNKMWQVSPRTVHDQLSSTCKTAADGRGSHWKILKTNCRPDTQVALQLSSFFVPPRKSQCRDSTCFACELLVKQMVVILLAITIDSFVCPFIGPIESTSWSASKPQVICNSWFMALSFAWWMLLLVANWGKIAFDVITKLKLNLIEVFNVI